MQQEKIIVLGSGYSGCGAVFDYLSGREDIGDPLKGTEFRLIQDPGGIANLHNSIKSSFHINSASKAIKDFYKLCEVMGRPGYATSSGIDYKKIIPDYKDKINSYINNITAVKYKGMPACEVMHLQAVKQVVLRIWRKLMKKAGIRKPGVGTVFVPVTEDVFLKESAIFIDSLLSNSNQKNIVINQGGSFWAPVSSTRYYSGDRKVIIVTRDPKDVYAELKTKGYAYPGTDVELFCKWYIESMKHISGEEWGKPLVYRVKFEEFVQNFEQAKVKLSRHLGIPGNINSSYDPEQSKKNIDKYKEILTPEEIKEIEEIVAKHHEIISRFN